MGWGLIWELQKREKRLESFLYSGNLGGDQYLRQGCYPETKEEEAKEALNYDSSASCLSASLRK